MFKREPCSVYGVIEMMPPPEALDLARRILACEAVEDKSSRPMESAALLANEKLRLHLCALVGVAGYQGLLSRALRLAREEAPSLGAVQVTAEGYLQGVGQLELNIDQDPATEGGVILLAQLLGLFISFIGEALTLRLVQDVAPHLAVTTKPGISTPFKTILQEVDQLKNMSERLKSLADQHPIVEDALMTISGNITNTATLLELLVHIRGKSGTLLENLPKQDGEPYVM
jgi:hypothetical protein